MQGEDEPKAREQGFKVCNTPINTNIMKLSTFLWFLIFFLFFLLCFTTTKNCIPLHLLLHRCSFCEVVEQM
jgi:hypothetical protein